VATYRAIYDLIDQVDRRIGGQHQLFVTFAQCLVNTLQTCVTLLPDGTTFISAGDIPAMWLRDSAAQVGPYVAFARQDPDLRRLIGGLIRRQARCILDDPYANAFNRSPGHHLTDDHPEPGPPVWERKFELDSLCYPIILCADYWQATGDRTYFDATVLRMLRTIVATMEIEQDHQHRSTYWFQRPHPHGPHDTLPNAGKGSPVGYTGMVWSGFRPSDDACRFGYLIPANMFAVVALDRLSGLARQIYGNYALADRAQTLRGAIDQGIQAYGVIEHPEFGRIYAYETDGLGNYALMDDANVPSLLSIPYIGYRPASDPVYQNTKRFVLSEANPYYFEGTYASGVGSPHTPVGYVWHLALIVRGLTTEDPREQQDILRTLISTTAETWYMHESFDPDNPARFTRSWFGWANSLFAQYLLGLLATGRI
jgi:meiotically up-regulated gene 157 (Mug157) protein